ncbi:CHAD domain-containing protein [Aureimonas jatrophae]|uniref:CHAD domain-containing protein n=1 Tax=Aureimonas jatrophae TaxID=1166073 RepID=A0A1H0D2J9_9HYPH|nr:CHAD domain-containing protein [Aureimonas jatrophae]MBB3951676.1 CHAD domain-containing protein [Aureimonas jatrophae]SDN64348.1 CHAD domain-containing protein [Aureimonas jatrophae]
MAYRLDPTAPLDAEIRRIAGEQIDRAVGDLAGHGEDESAVHEARKRMKKLRALVRLARGARPDFARDENARYRDAAKGVGGARDRVALIEALDGLAERFADESPRLFAKARRTLEERRDRALGSNGDLAARAAETADALRAGRSRLDGFTLPHSAKRQRDALAAGLAHNLSQARRDRRAVRRHGTAETFHDLRKRIKYLGHHLRLLEPVWPGVLQAMREDADLAAEHLGRDHDYAVLLTEIEAEPARFGTSADVARLRALLARHGQELRAQALAPVDRLLSEAPKALADRLARLWREARRAGADGSS